MAQYCIYHSTPEFFREATGFGFGETYRRAVVNGIEGAAARGNFRRYGYVASIEAEDLCSAYDLTQNVVGPWTESERVLYRPLDAGPARSTSVGDALIDEKGRIFVVAPFGFEEVTDEVIGVEVDRLDIETA
jgi:hypothetical protein